MPTNYKMTTDPPRLRALRLLQTVTITPAQCAAQLRMSPQSAAHLLRRMTEVGLCERTPEGRTYRYRACVQLAERR